MRYGEFVDAWREAFERTGARFSPFGTPTETIDLQSMTRRYSSRLAGVQSVEAFTVSASLAWVWEPLHFARTATTEEDLLTQLHGRVQVDAIQTERPWLRVDVRLAAHAHLDAKLHLPDSASWRKWVLEVGSRLEPVLPSLQHDKDDPHAVTGWRGEPSVELRCGEGGQLYLTGVLVEAWRAVDVPRVWDDSERPQDADPREALSLLARNVQSALGIWSEALSTLRQAASLH